MLLLFGGAPNGRRNAPCSTRSGVARRLVEEIGATGYFLAPQRVANYADGRELLARGEAIALVVIPHDFQRDTFRSRPQIQVLLDGAEPLTAARIGGTIGQVAHNFDPDLRTAAARTKPDCRRARASGSTRPHRDFLAALAGMLLTNLCFSASSLGLVGERESGTYEATLALPISPLEIVLGKLVPYVAVSYLVLTIAILGAGILFGIWPNGSWLAIGALTLPFVFASLSVGVLISALVHSSAQAVFLTVFVILPSFVLSGVMFPYQLMPHGVRELGAILPLRWYQIGLRRLGLRGGDFGDVWVPFVALCLLFAVLLSLVRWRMKPRLG
jgi:ABC-2 type transport system permease protein